MLSKPRKAIPIALVFIEDRTDCMVVGAPENHTVSMMGAPGNCTVSTRGLVSKVRSVHWSRKTSTFFT